MKRIYLLTGQILLFLSFSFSQAPQKMNYQAVARNSGGVAQQNQNIGLRFTVHDIMPNGTIVYQETQNSTTNQFGLFMAEIGSGTVTTGTFAGIDWASGNKYLQVEIDAIGGTTFTDMGTSQLLSVPFALFARSSANVWGSTGHIPKFLGVHSLTNSQIYDDASNVGIGTTSPFSKLSVAVSTTDASAGISITNALTGGKTIAINQGQVGKLNFTEPGVTDLVTMDFNNNRVGINNTSPAYPLHVTTNDLSGIAGYFVNYNVGTGLWGTCSSGVGVHAEGGTVGVYGRAYDYSGTLNRGASGQAGNGNINEGVYGYASGGTAAYGIAGYASGATTNWAGYFTGSVYASGTFQSSDRKLKSAVMPLSNALSIVNRLNPCNYIYKTEEYKQMSLPEGLHYGLIADEVEKVLPNVVKEAVQPAEYEKHDWGNGKKINDEVHFMSVNYTEIIPILIGAVKELKKEIEEMKKK